MTAQKPPAGGKPAPQDDDPWSRLARANQAAARGEHPDAAELGDTASLMRRGGAGATVSESEGPSTEILQLVSDSLSAEPDRADLWTMRFEVQRSLGLKQEFADALMQGWRNPRLARGIDWSHVRRLWEELAPGEPVPGGVKLPSPAPSPRGTPVSPVPAPAQRAARNRRFADVAIHLAGRELAVFAKAYAALHSRPGFLENMARKVAPMLKRPTPLQPASNLSRAWGGARILLKREDRRQVAPEDENATAQAYIAAQLGRPLMITGNDVDGHSLALARVAPQFKLACTIVVRAADLADKPAFVAELRALGAKVEAMPMTGMLTQDPREAALRLWQKSLGHAYLAMSLGTGPAPYPAMSNHFQSLLGRETELQLRASAPEGRPRSLIAAVQSEGDSIGFMLPQLSRQDVELLYAEPEPGGVASWRPSARLRAYNGVVREHAWLRGLGRIEHVAIPDTQALDAQRQISALERIEVSLEDARALALAQLMAQRNPDPRDFVVLVA